MKTYEWTAVLANSHRSENAALSEAERAYSLSSKNVYVEGIGISCGVGYVIFRSPARTQQAARKAFVKAIRARGITAHVPFVFKDQLR